MTFTQLFSSALKDLTCTGTLAGSHKSKLTNNLKSCPQSTQTQ